MRDDRHHGLYFIVGALLGALAALLFAPKTGKQTRDFLKNTLEHSDEIIDKTKVSADEVISKTKTQIESMIDSVSKTLDEKIHKDHKKGSCCGNHTEEEEVEAT